MMSSRMDKYNFQESNNVGSRTSKNSGLYKELATNRITTNIKNLDNNNNVVEITGLGSSQVNIRHRNSKNEENFKEFSSATNTNFYENMFGDDIENKNYDVNDVLDMAKKNRSDEDEEEKKKRLKSIEYSILSDLSKDKIQEYHERKTRGITQEEADNLEELINTITSNKLRKQIDDELFSDLMPSEPDETVISSNLLDELKNEKMAKMEKMNSNLDDDSDSLADNLDADIDKSFYTHSMDLKKEDLIIDDDNEMDNDLDESFKEEKSNVGKIIIIILLVLVIIGIIGYCIYSFL